MITVEDLLKDKGRQVHTTTPTTSVYEALKLMADKGIGALVVLEDQKLVGMISERDYARKIILKGKLSQNTQVGEIMSQNVVCVNRRETIERCMALMTEKMVRHMPVVEDDRIKGLISIGDVVKSIISTHEVSRSIINVLLQHSLGDMSLSDLLKETLDLILSIPWLSFEKRGVVFIVEKGSNRLTMAAESGLCDIIKDSCAQVPLGKCLCGRAAVSQNIEFSDGLDARHEIRYDGIAPHGHVCVPICYEGSTLGVLTIYVRPGHQRSQQEEAFLTAVANTLAGIIMRKRLEAELVQSARLAAVGQTVAGLAHCTKSILFGLEGGIYIVNKGIRKDDTQKLLTGWNMVQKNIAKVSNLVIDLLDYAKKGSPQYEICSPNRIAEEVCELITYKSRDLSAGQITFIRDFAPDLGHFLLDPKGIHRCLLNLIDNAVDACLSDEAEGKNHWVKITTRKEGEDTLVLQVADNGCGMSKDVREQMLSAFFTTKGSRGTGLGLLITQKIVREHKGSLSVTSTPGEGSAFTIVLPRQLPASLNQGQT
ncbi:MAG: ATP-binding protein [Desulfosarcina sp.]